ncbi:FUSC family membrane protein [Flavobacterium sp. DG1-102-2]|uniref:FUSC family protein n=1 Tax=Flavobacterium sp. DG1-102-2 TaxID=3081663 RepID=UPI002949C988|nr:FUSC family membrane protein [Flavobacterium sp. DG1-102-2]MDV6168082.1 FUSC family membrane protein [Flavobacterium sp. DG1-102-2]
MLQRIRNFTDSNNFTKAVIVTVAAAAPVMILSRFGYFQLGFAVALGAFLTYPADIPSNLLHRTKGLLTASLIVAGCVLIVNLLHPFKLLFYPLMFVLVFFLSMISVYGQRATMVSFSGLLATVLATGHIHTGWDILEYTALIFAGGLIYTLVSVSFNYLSPHRYTELQIADCMKLTAKYMKLRGDLWNADADRAAIVEKQLHLQVEINLNHENLREILLRSRYNSENSNRSRKMLLVFISLMEILELALSTSFDHSKLHQKFSEHPKVLNTYQNLAYNLASSLKKISKSIENRTKYTPKHQLLADLEALEKAILEYETELGKEAAAEGVWMLKNMLHYAEKQIEKIKLIERAFTEKIKFKELGNGRDKDLEKFLTPDYYPVHTLKENLGFSSTIFRHSMRLTMCIAMGTILSFIFPLQNVYWILLTIVVIMRPGYGLTKQRSYQRIVGTILGGVIAFAVLSFVHHPVIIGTLTIICMLLGYTFTATNYRIGATFVTIYVVFVYGMLTPDITHVIQYRILDTAIGVAITFAANYFLWPSWEFMSLPVFIKKSIEANRNYLSEISHYYNQKGIVPTSYRLARKNAFIELGNLMSSYQRMVQEPKSKQKQQNQVYKLAVLNHTLVSSLASLGTYIQSHKTSTASEAFNVVVNTVIKNLDNAIALLTMDTKANEAHEDNNEELALRFTELKNIRARELKEVHITDEEEFRLKMEEAHLVIEQLVWLTGLSEKIVKAARQLELKG